jgi:hypothetical protein
VTAKQKRAKQKKAVTFVAELILESLDQFPKEERKKRLTDIHRILNSSNRGKPYKRLSRGRTVGYPGSP